MAQPQSSPAIAPWPARTQGGAAAGLRVARYAGLDAHRRPLVWAGEGAGEAPCVARWLTGLSETTPVGSPVLLQWLSSDEPPLILGVVHDTVPQAQGGPMAEEGQPSPQRTATADGKRLVFEARQEVVLKCGEASITLLANGRVVIKGTELVSRAQGANKIRGATVSIN